MAERTRGEVEASLAKAIIQFEIEHLGRGPTETHVLVIEDLILVRLRGVLTPAELTLAHTSDGPPLIKEVRRQLIEGSRSLLEEIVLQETGSKVLSLHTDISAKRGERIIVFTLKDNLDRQFEWKKSRRNRPVG